MATSTDSAYRLYNWYLGRHSYLHLLAQNKLLATFPRLPQGLQASEYSEQIRALESRVTG